MFCLNPIVWSIPQIIQGYRFQIKTGHDKSKPDFSNIDLNLGVLDYDFEEKEKAAFSTLTI